MKHSKKIEVYSSLPNLLGEGPIWSSAEQTLYWLDIGRKMLCSRSLSDARANSWKLSDYPGCIAELSRGAIAIAMGRGVHRLDLRSGTFDVLCSLQSMHTAARFNDGKVDPLGRFWAGTMQNNFGPDGAPIAVDQTIGALYRFDGDGTVTTIEEQVGIANTLAWSPDLRRFYFADSLQGQLFAYDFDAESGRVWNKRLLFDSPGYGVPDGSAMDVDGCLWNARWDAGVVLRITPTGTMDQVIELPVPRPTSCAFGGPGLDTLFVTSACNGLSAGQIERFPQSGSVFAIERVAQGLAVPKFAHPLSNHNNVVE